MTLSVCYVVFFSYPLNQSDLCSSSKRILPSTPSVNALYTSGPSSVHHAVQPNNITYAECATRYPSVKTNPSFFHENLAQNAIWFLFSTKRAMGTVFLCAAATCWSMLSCDAAKYTTLFIYTGFLYTHSLLVSIQIRSNFIYSKRTVVCHVRVSFFAGRQQSIAYLQRNVLALICWRIRLACDFSWVRSPISHQNLCNFEANKIEQGKRTQKRTEIDELNI